MPTNRITMRQIRESLRLHLHGGLSYNEVGRCLKISKSVVGKYMSLARVAGVDWAIAQTLTDEELEARLYQPAVPRSSYQLAPDFANVHLELKRAGVTLQLLWEEYAKDNALAYKYTSFCGLPAPRHVKPPPTGLTPRCRHLSSSVVCHG